MPSPSVLSFPLSSPEIGQGEVLFEELAEYAARELLRAVQGTFLCRFTAERLRRNVKPPLPLVQKNDRHTLRSKVELDELVVQLKGALDLTCRAATAPCWNIYHTAQLARSMEAANKGIKRWLAGARAVPLPSFLKPSSTSKTSTAPAWSTSSSSLFPLSSSTSSFSTNYTFSTSGAELVAGRGRGAGDRLRAWAGQGGAWPASLRPGGVWPGRSSRPGGAPASLLATYSSSCRRADEVK